MKRSARMFGMAARLLVGTARANAPRIARATRGRRRTLARPYEQQGQEGGAGEDRGGVGPGGAAVDVLGGQPERDQHLLEVGEVDLRRHREDRAEAVAR
jgi:hypothetical protein